MLIENYILDNIIAPKKEGFQDVKSDTFKTIILVIFEIIIILVAIYLSWNCNKSQPPLVRIIISILAAIFSGIYILFYVIYYNILNAQCN